MSTMPKVSVVTTTYNDMDNLCRIMEEVRKQTYKNIEHIIVDGGSTDGTVEMLTRLSEEQPGAFRWISEPDDGIYDAINKGLKLCTGDIIGTCFDHFADETVLARIIPVDAQSDQLTRAAGVFAISARMAALESLRGTLMRA